MPTYSTRTPTKLRRNNRNSAPNFSSSASTLINLPLPYHGVVTYDTITTSSPPASPTPTVLSCPTLRYSTCGLPPTTHCRSSAANIFSDSNDYYDEEEEVVPRFLTTGPGTISPTSFTSTVNRHRRSNSSSSSNRRRQPAFITQVFPNSPPNPPLHIRRAPKLSAFSSDKDNNSNSSSSSSRTRCSIHNQLSPSPPSGPIFAAAAAAAAAAVPPINTAIAATLPSHRVSDSGYRPMIWDSFPAVGPHHAQPVAATTRHMRHSPAIYNSPHHHPDTMARHSSSTPRHRPLSIAMSIELSRMESQAILNGRLPPSPSTTNITKRTTASVAVNNYLPTTTTTTTSSSSSSSLASLSASSRSNPSRLEPNYGDYYYDCDDRSRSSDNENVAITGSSGGSDVSRNHSISSTTTFRRVNPTQSATAVASSSSSSTTTTTTTTSHTQIPPLLSYARRTSSLKFATSQHNRHFRRRNVDGNSGDEISNEVSVSRAATVNYPTINTNQTHHHHRHLLRQACHHARSLNTSPVSPSLPQQRSPNTATTIAAATGSGLRYSQTVAADNNNHYYCHSGAQQGRQIPGSTNDVSIVGVDVRTLSSPSPSNALYPGTTDGDDSSSSCQVGESEVTLTTAHHLPRQQHQHQQEKDNYHRYCRRQSTNMTDKGDEVYYCVSSSPSHASLSSIPAAAALLDATTDLIVVDPTPLLTATDTTSPPTAQSYLSPGRTCSLEVTNC